MREIKFRVWDRDYKRMHIVGEFHHDSLNIDEDNNIYYLNLQCMEASPHKGMDPEHCTYRLMRYTGFKDKNGREIYEEDICKYHDLIGRVIFEDGAFVLRSGIYSAWFMSSDISQFKVVGNIYEIQNC